MSTFNDGFWPQQNASGAFYYPNTTITTTGTTLVTNLPQMPMQVSYAPVEPEDEMGWLRRRVSEITELVAA